MERELHQMTITVPTTIGVDAMTAYELTCREDQIERIALEMTALAGGCTRTEGLGYYRNHAGKPVREVVSMLTSLVDDVAYTALLDYLRGEASFFARIYRQESVMVTVTQYGAVVDFITE